MIYKNKIIAFISPKGGVGKSTLTRLVSINMYCSFNPEKDCNYINIIDLDFPQHTIAKTRKKEIEILKDKEEVEANLYYSNKYFKQYNNGFLNINIQKDKIEEFDIIKYKKDSQYQYTFIDIVGSANAEGYNQKFLQNIDLIIIPFSSKFDEIEVGVSFIKNIIKPLKENNIIKDYAALLNSADTRNIDAYKEIQNSMNNNGFNVFNTIIPNKAKYSRLYMQHKSKGMLSTLFPFYDMHINNLINEIQNKI
ncbi:ParA family protein [Tenacibaculum finnmarkense]|uniref:ParA family protein n=1 Tax=Tenacibaculum finnmarkense TaxID=2781243 RepID=UPI00187BB558|nr:ParA family protein [Tenacibaculum finnmarkense]MBE7634984.1 hypothetical protein [Tenacibaculum finnmarkense genomovar ulcerans]MBE7649032.1 hypothetical protein [Tenacibaculum finnmarkense genomovar ulcerans]MCD8401462.1 hypothetical protein [Tenacibaculum finnmarkense genomovar ulcerans]MCD8403827.1 hypothetical protein [Tenacibaculum finnmarkense genomovar finnmarkense]MCD8430897.1 hypothetical protein [Tenacibaculum finnmarkense genomovar ulcerans]